jgi:hypothetical protein
MPKDEVIKRTRDCPIQRTYKLSTGKPTNIMYGTNTIFFTKATVSIFVMVDIKAEKARSFILWILEKSMISSLIPALF